MMKKLHARRQRSTAQKQQAGYSPEKFKSDLKRVRTVFDNVAASRDRSAIYKYWHAAYRLRRKWRRLRRNEGVKIKKIAKRTVKGGIPPSSGDDLLRFIIDATTSTKIHTPANRTKLSKLKSKYFSLLNYGYKQGVNTRDLTSFIKQHGGLNFKTSVPRKTKQKKGGSGK